MSTKIPDLEVDECDGLIELTQASGGDYPNAVYLHPTHLRFLAERFGLVETSDPRALHRIATLERRLRKMQERIGHLAWYLEDCSDHEHADLNWETDYARATAEIGEEFCADLGDPSAWSAPGQHAASTLPAQCSAPLTGNAPCVTSALPQVTKSAAERAKDYRARKRHAVTEPRDASRDDVTPHVTGQLELKP